jgi:hypothetical protein
VFEAVGDGGLIIALGITAYCLHRWGCAMFCQCITLDITEACRYVSILLITGCMLCMSDVLHSYITRKMVLNKRQKAQKKSDGEPESSSGVSSRKPTRRAA